MGECYRVRLERCFGSGLEEDGFGMVNSDYT